MKNLILSTIYFFSPSLFIIIIAVILGTNITKNNEELFNNNLVIQENLVVEDIRVQTLQKFFEKYNSPLKDHAKTFVAMADEYNIDYKLLPAISCMESTCAKKMIPNSYNPFGWGIYGNNYISFNDFDHAIETVAKGIHKGYISKGLDTVEKIAPVYTPPNYNHWMSGVNFFIYDIKEFEQVQKNNEIKQKVLFYL